MEKEQDVRRRVKDVTSLSEQFQCLACRYKVILFTSFPELENHFLCIHKVSNLLTGPATSAVLLPTTLESFTCNLCSEGGWLKEQDVREHLGISHGDFFRDGQGFIVVTCRYAIKTSTQSMRILTAR